MKPTKDLEEAIATPEQPAKEEVRKRIAKAEERIAEQDKTIAELKAKIDRLESANELLNELPPKWEPKAGDWVVVTEATWNNCPYKVGDIAKVTHRDSLHPWLEGKGSFTAGVCVVDECLRLATPEEIEAATRPKWEPKFGERVMTPRGEGIYWNKWLDKMHTVIFEDGSKNYNLEELSPIEP